jgi:hypothetical protein
MGIGALDDIVADEYSDTFESRGKVMGIGALDDVVADDKNIINESTQEISKSRDNAEEYYQEEFETESVDSKSIVSPPIPTKSAIREPYPPKESHDKHAPLHSSISHSKPASTLPSDKIANNNDSKFLRFVFSLLSPFYMINI